MGIAIVLGQSVLTEVGMTRSHRGREGGGGGGRGARGRGSNSFGNTSIGEELRIAVNLALKNFRQKEEETELEFPSSLLSTERCNSPRAVPALAVPARCTG